MLLFGPKMTHFFILRIIRILLRNPKLPLLMPHSEKNSKLLILGPKTILSSSSVIVIIIININLGSL